jgi:ubiquinone/menaquinone biosynthesis C-methylase UbiE
MHEIPEWQYDEMKAPGVDYTDDNIVAEYDDNHSRFRNYKKNAEDIISILGLEPEHSVIDMGCGTGAFSLYAAGHCKKIYAVDVSAPMIEYLKKKAIKKKLNNNECPQAGFLT